MKQTNVQLLKFSDGSIEARIFTRVGSICGRGKCVNEALIDLAAQLSPFSDESLYWYSM